MIKNLIEQFEYLRNDLGSNAIDNYNAINDVINSADPYLYHKLKKTQNELMEIIYDTELEEEMKNHTHSISGMRVFLGDSRDDDIYRLENGNLKNITHDIFDTLIYDLITVLEND